MGPLLRTGDRFWANVAMIPVGGPCRCGGGVSFTLERRDGEWVVVESASWIS